MAFKITYHDLILKLEPEQFEISQVSYIWK